MVNQPTNALAVNSKTIETVYREYLENVYGVNRSYQRKLVWSVEEKQSLIDSILHQYPLPQFLVAEATADNVHRFEIIDGMQRLNAIISFIENDFPLNGKYFDLQSLASTKKLFDDGEIEQIKPVMSRKESVRFATYELAMSAYRTNDKDSIEEVFRRINSSGQKLSRQDLRQAGSTSPVADLVRDLSSRLRGDHSPTEIVPLSGMKALSISSTNNKYGISPEDMMWVQQGILDRRGVRSSGDEQLVLDLVSNMLFNPLLGTGTPARNALFQVEYSGAPEAVLRRINSELQDPFWLAGKKEFIAKRFMKTFDRITLIFAELPNGTSFKKHIGAPSNNPVPRYFEAFFTAVYSIMFESKRDLSNAKLAAQQLGNAKLFENMPGGGGEWPSGKKIRTVDQIKTLLDHAFDSPFDPDSEAVVSDALTMSQFDTLVTGVLLESSSRDLKQGFLTLAPHEQRFDERAFAKMMKTLTAISNTHPKTGGHVLVGVADSSADALRVKDIYEIEALHYRSLLIVGVDREAALQGEDLNSYWGRIIRKVSEHSRFDSNYARRAASESAIAIYHGRAVFVLKAPSTDKPVSYDDAFYSRISSETRLAADEMQFGMDFQSRLHN